jgi:hypothetical protein
MTEKRCGTCRCFYRSTYCQEEGFCGMIGDEKRPVSKGLAVIILHETPSARASLCVHEDFGCVLWEPKPPKGRPAAETSRP